MTWTYTGNPSTNSIDEVRLMIGDTDPTDQQLQNAEIQYAITKYSDPYKAAAFCCRTLAAKYARQVDSAIESIRVSASQKHEQYMTLAKTIEQEGEAFSPAANVGVYVGGVSESDYISVTSDTDRVVPKFTQDQFDNKAGAGGV